MRRGEHSVRYLMSAREDTLSITAAITEYMRSGETSLDRSFGLLVQYLYINGHLSRNQVHDFMYPNAQIIDRNGDPI